MRFSTPSFKTAILALLLGAVRGAEGQTTAEEIILRIMPDSATCDQGAEECRTAVQAAPYLIKAFDTYNIRDAAAIAAILATIGTESVDLKWKTNQSPGRPGQGTSNMQMYNFNYEFAQTIPELKAEVDGIEGASDSDPSDETKNKVLELVIDDKYNFQTGAWYFSSHCTDDQKNAFKSGGDLDKAFEEYTLTCIGAAAVEDARAERWNRAKDAFGL